MLSYRQNDGTPDANPAVTNVNRMEFNLLERQTSVDTHREFGSTLLVADGKFCGVDFAGKFQFRIIA